MGIRRRDQDAPEGADVAGRFAGEGLVATVGPVGCECMEASP